MLYTLGSMIMYVTIEPSFLFEKIIMANLNKITPIS
jgi:predicted HAD superfamily Cof-like phosphohydrolase